MTNATEIVNGMPSQYTLVYDTNPELNIQTEGYSFSDYKMTLEFKAISSLLMGEKIYGSKTLGLSGTGMSMDIIKKHFLNIGVSYYNSADFLLKDFDYKPIGNFGIGFLSCFMLSDEVKVKTRHYKPKYKYLIELEKADEWTSITESEDVVFDGTEVILNYTNFIEVFDNKPQKVQDFLNQYFLTDGIEFELVNKSDKQIAKITNPIFLAELPEKGLIKIDFKDYLKDIEGYALIKIKSSFIKTFEEIDFNGKVYKYNDENGLSEVADFSSLKIDDYISGKEIKYYCCPR